MISIGCCGRPSRLVSEAKAQVLIKYMCSCTHENKQNYFFQCTLDFSLQANKQANKRVHLPLRQYDSAFQQTVFFLLNRTSVHHQLNPLLAESQTEVDLFSRVGKSACCTPTSLVPLLQDQVKLYQCFKTRVLNPFLICTHATNTRAICTPHTSFVPLFRDQGNELYTTSG